MIPALVLAAGLATRLRPLSHVRAKAALPVAGRPLIHRIIDRLSTAGVDDLVVNLHHLPHTITSLLGDGGDRRLFAFELDEGADRRLVDGDDEALERQLLAVLLVAEARHEAE